MSVLLGRKISAPDFRRVVERPRWWEHQFFGFTIGNWFFGIWRVRTRP